eukprot:CAMPEP_0202484542 /NCGR_PEP_ID=MMETSP1361-20130828/3617_1 /ASSEMBLY_ACC=CAM_ASM_000849 /TAXON_ID=210615 /ORGANISM="Staurosira complex sp., Strain CCMP2646" /LENGTH=161 /DNA_ID=CAMNT_0049113231 /DNA_START=532 /DNA_END=1017 /DNA_ORIENTATION=+
MDLSLILELAQCSTEGFVEQDSSGNTPLHWLCYHGRLAKEGLEALVEYNQELPFIRNSVGRIPLHSVFEDFWEDAHPCHLPPYQETSICLLEKYPHCSQVIDKNGMTPLVFACMCDLSLDLIYDYVRVNPVATLGPSFRHEEPQQPVQDLPSISLNRKSPI